MTSADTKASPPVQAWEASAADTPPINLEARFASGDACFFAYAYLSFCRFDRSGTIELHFASRILRLEGRNLYGLFLALGKHAVSSVREIDHHTKTAESDTVIDKIDVTDTDA